MKVCGEKNVDCFEDTRVVFFHTTQTLIFENECYLNILAYLHRALCCIH